MYNNGTKVETGAELNMYIAIVHCIFVLLSGFFVILEARVLFCIALKIHPERPFQMKCPDTLVTRDAVSCGVLAVLDLFIIFMIKKIIFDVNEGQQILLDRVSGNAYYIIKDIPYSSRLLSSRVSDDISSSELRDSLSLSSEPVILEMEEALPVAFRAHSMECSVVEQFLKVSIKTDLSASRR
jgi:hypothetical protein